MWCVCVFVLYIFVIHQDPYFVSRFGIEAVTLEGFEKSGREIEAKFYQVGRVIESIVRSLNNLLERFHQSYFFYLLPSTDRYISIGKKNRSNSNKISKERERTASERIIFQEYI